MSDSDGDLIPAPIRHFKFSRTTGRDTSAVINRAGLRPSGQAEPLPSWDPDYSSDHDSRSSDFNDATSVILNGKSKDQIDQDNTDRELSSEDDRPHWAGVGQACPVDKYGRYRYSQLPDSSPEPETITDAVPLAISVNEPANLPASDLAPSSKATQKRGRSPSEDSGVCPEASRTQEDLVGVVIREVGKMVNSLDRQTEVLSGILGAMRSKE
ncbi:hypothetical protein BDN67DRAFT_984874 [Paxillus ammoniavirescens]|nr:hypothetical protein BDN67DRAFT_984874 [Paxillus ammoniavirescens]